MQGIPASDYPTSSNGKKNIIYFFSLPSFRTLVPLMSLFMFLRMNCFMALGTEAYQVVIGQCQARIVSQVDDMVDSGRPCISSLLSTSHACMMVPAQDMLPLSLPPGRVIKCFPPTIGCGCHLPYPFTCCHLLLIHPVLPITKGPRFSRVLFTLSI